jgi:hypothetical protein
MSTPVINEERQAKAEALLSKAEGIALQAEKEAAAVIRSQGEPQTDALYVFEVYDFEREGRATAGPVLSPLRVPLILPENVRAVSNRDKWKKCAGFADQSTALAQRQLQC